ncbi:CBS domain-containing protein [Actinomadura alba]|uniref:CBS domain-containing protein n=1 Tax=Actinomadura alba TaxID=406431 RepID=UPI0035E4232C
MIVIDERRISRPRRWRAVRVGRPGRSTQRARARRSSCPGAMAPVPAAVSVFGGSGSVGAAGACEGAGARPIRGRSEVVGMLVREVMTSPVVTVPSDWTVKQAVHLLYERDVTAAGRVCPRGALCCPVRGPSALPLVMSIRLR